MFLALAGKTSTNTHRTTIYLLPDMSNYSEVLFIKLTSVWL